jgi:template-activating factor I
MPDKYEAELPDEVHELLATADKDREIRVSRAATAENLKFLELVRSKVKDVPMFWAVTLLSHSDIAKAVSSTSDKEALTHLSDVELIQDAHDPREFEIVFHFKENPYFTNTELRKKFSLPAGTKPAPTDDTITDEMRAFEPDDLEPSVSATAVVCVWVLTTCVCARHLLASLPCHSS